MRIWSLAWAIVVMIAAGCSTTPQQNPATPVNRTPLVKELSPGVYHVPVDSRAGWVNTQIQLRSGQTLRIQADGQWGESPGIHRTADGGQAGMFGSGYWGVIPPVQGPTYWGALVGRIGGGSAFMIGSIYNGKVERDGLLQLSINDGMDQMSDNHGSMNVKIQVSR